MVVIHSLSEALAPQKYYSWQTSVSMKFEPQFIQVLTQNSCIHPWKAGNQTSNDPFKNMRKSGEWAHGNDTDYLQHILWSQSSCLTQLALSLTLKCDRRTTALTPCWYCLMTLFWFLQIYGEIYGDRHELCGSVFMSQGSYTIRNLLCICQYNACSYIMLRTGTCA